MLTGMLIELLIILASLAYLAVDAFWSQDFPPQLANLVANDVIIPSGSSGFVSRSEISRKKMFS